MSGGAKCWGSNERGQLGNGSSDNSSVPVDVIGLENNVIAVAAMGQHSCAVNNSGLVRCWGLNDYHQLGDGTKTIARSPVNVLGVSDAASVTGGALHTCALQRIGSVMCWGRNVEGLLGNGTSTETGSPANVIGIDNSAKSINSRVWHTCIVTTDDRLRCWGYNGYGALGNGTKNDASNPVAVVGLDGVSQFTAGGDFTCALAKNGQLQCWGRNQYGQHSNGTKNDSSVPVNSAGAIGFTAIAGGWYHVCALVFDGTVKCWGRNDSGQLGNGTTTDSLTPVTVVGLGIMAKVPPTLTVSLAAFDVASSPVADVSGAVALPDVMPIMPIAATPIGTATETPTATPTATPTMTPIPTKWPTAAATMVPSETIESSPTATPTSTQTFEPTTTATATVEPAATPTDTVPLTNTLLLTATAESTGTLAFALRGYTMTVEGLTPGALLTVSEASAFTLTVPPTGTQFVVTFDAAQTVTLTLAGSDASVWIMSSPSTWFPISIDVDPRRYTLSPAQPYAIVTP
jgi:hypothetical protein